MHSDPHPQRHLGYLDPYVSIRHLCGPWSLSHPALGTEQDSQALGGSFTSVNPGQGTQSLELTASIKAEFKVVLSHFFLHSTLRIFVPIVAFGSIWNFISKDSEKQNGKVENTWTLQSRVHEEMKRPRHPFAIWPSSKQLEVNSHFSKTSPRSAPDSVCIWKKAQQQSDAQNFPSEHLLREAQRTSLPPPPD